MTCFLRLTTYDLRFKTTYYLLLITSIIFLLNYESFSQNNQLSQNFIFGSNAKVGKSAESKRSKTLL